MVPDLEALVPAPGDTALLERLLSLIERVPQPAAAPRRGRPDVYSERLFLKAAVVMVLRHVRTVHGLLALLEEPVMARVRERLHERGRFPTRRTWERRLGRLAATLPAQIAHLGAWLLPRLQPWAAGGQAAALDSQALHARGKPWHQRHRREGRVPDTRIDTDAHWTRSGWHGFVYGYKLHVVVTVSPDVWLPLAADLTPANVADNAHGLVLLEAAVAAARAAGAAAGAELAGVYLLADSGYRDAPGVLPARCAGYGAVAVISRRGPHPHGDAGAPVRSIFHQLRTHSIENWNGQFKAIFDCGAQLPTRGLQATRRFVLGGVYVDQLTLLDRFLAGRSLRVGLKPALQAA